jgi:Spy/CpxP family protein refolding chaperone
MMNAHGEGAPGMPRSDEEKWWKNSELAQKLHLSDDQVQKLDKIAQDHHMQEIDLRADVERQDSALRFQMETDPPNQANILAQIDKVTLARANLEKSHVEMLLAIRHTLTTEQARMLRESQRHDGPPSPGFGPRDEGRGGPEGGPGGPPDGPPGPPPQSNSN